MRILLVSDFFPPVVGGLERHVATLASALAARDHEVHVATMTEAPIADDEKVAVHSIDAAFTKWLPHSDPTRPFHAPLPDPYARRSLNRLIRSIGPDVIHAHSWLAVSLPRTPGIPLIFTAHDYALLCPRRTLLYRDRRLCSGPARFKCSACLTDHLSLPTAVALSLSTPMGRGLIRPQRAITVSEETRRRLQAVLPGATVIRNFTPAEPPSDWTGALNLPQRPFVMFAGDGSPHKGIDVLLSAWTGDDAINAPLLIASWRPVTAALPANVTVVSVPHPAITAAWEAAAIAVVPSIWPDPAPTVVLEAMAAGTPVVACRIGGLPELIDDGVEGLLIPPGDRSALVRAVESLLGDEPTRARMGESARRRAAKSAVHKVVAEIEGVYQSALEAVALGHGSVRKPTHGAKS